MALDINQLTNVKRMSDGRTIAQCPACAESGHDRNGKNHLIIWPDGRFGCVANPGDKEHRKRIWGLVGDKRESPPLVPMAAIVRRWKAGRV